MSGTVYLDNVNAAEVDERNVYAVYITEKRKLENMGLAAFEYMQEVRRLAERLGI